MTLGKIKNTNNSGRNAIYVDGLQRTVNNHDERQRQFGEEDHSWRLVLERSHLWGRYFSLFTEWWISEIRIKIRRIDGNTSQMDIKSLAHEVNPWDTWQG